MRGALLDGVHIQIFKTKNTEKFIYSRPAEVFEISTNFIINILSRLSITITKTSSVLAAAALFCFPFDLEQKTVRHQKDFRAV